jgi:hypothetical protein
LPANGGQQRAFKSSEHYQVAMSTSSECPSQRTVFVKCGDFECGQDSFGQQLIKTAPADDDGDQSAAPSADESYGSRAPKGPAGPIMNDFPWLVSGLES